MSSEENEYILNELIDKKKWNDILARFTDVLRLNILIVDARGQVVIPPIFDKRYGWDFFAQTCLGLSKSDKSSNILSKFRNNGEILEYRCESGLHGFAIPVKVADGESVAYIIVGPVILNKKEDLAFYKEIAEELNYSYSDLTDAINAVRVVSFISMKSISDLLSEVAKDVIQLKIEKKKINQLELEQKGVSHEVSEDIRDTAEEMYTTIHIDELLVTLLDIALKMTNTECGSIMVVDDKQKELSIKVSRGLKTEKIQNTRVKIGEGVAGIAAKENSSFVIHGTEGENRIKHLLKRTEIKHSIVMPLTTRKNSVFGVLNLHTKNQNIQIDDNLGNLQYLSKLISAAFQSI